jgi:hypothetical protein
MYLSYPYLTMAYLQVVAPSSLAYTAETVTATKGQAIAQNSPSYSGESVTSWSISPALPSGLSFNTSTGVISGTPTALATQAVYTVTAANAGGSTTRGVTFTVIDVAPSAMSYAYATQTYTKGTAITTNSPSSSGGPVISYSVSPALPSGLSLNTATGVISGTPSSLAAAANYTVTATNTGGSTTAVLAVTVNDAAPLMLSYAGSPYVFLRNVALAPRSPSVSGGAVVSYSVSPSLPAGLALNTATGVLSGTPSVVAAAGFYTVTATNTGGSTTFAVSVAISDASPIIAVPPAYVSGSKATLSVNRASLSALSKVQQHPVLSEQAQWAKVQAVYENTSIPYGDTDRIVGVRFRGSLTMAGRFKAEAESGDTYRMKGVYISGAGHRLKISRDDLETPSVLDFTVS